MNGKNLGLILAFALLAPLTISAQGTLYASNLGEPISAIGAGVAQDRWIAAQFFTGTNSDGYTLGSIQVLMTGTGGSPSGFSLMLYTDNSGLPGNILGTLSGSSNPSTGGTYDYTATGKTLSSLTPYWIVATAATPAFPANFYGWQVASDSNYTLNGGWNVGLTGYSANGANWNTFSSPVQFGIIATPVPEPQTLALVGFGLAAIFYRLRKLFLQFEMLKQNYNAFAFIPVFP